MFFNVVLKISKLQNQIRDHIFMLSIKIYFAVYFPFIGSAEDVPVETT